MFENLGVGQSPGTAYWFKHTENIGMSRISDGNTAPGPEFAAPGVAVKIERLDIEGAELGALKSNDWNRWRPGVIIMEAHDCDFDRPRVNLAVAYPHEQDYRLTDKIGANVVLRLA